VATGWQLAAGSWHRYLSTAWFSQQALETGIPQQAC